MSVETIQNVSIKASETKLPKMHQMNINERRESAAAANAMIDSGVQKLETVIPSVVAAGKGQQAINAKNKAISIIIRTIARSVFFSDKGVNQLRIILRCGSSLFGGIGVKGVVINNIYLITKGCNSLQ